MPCSATKKNSRENKRAGSIFHIAFWNTQTWKNVSFVYLISESVSIFSKQFSAWFSVTRKNVFIYQGWIQVSKLGTRCQLSSEDFNILALSDFLHLSTCDSRQAVTYREKCIEAVLCVILVELLPSVCHRLCGEGSKGVRLLSLKAPFDHMYQFTALGEICSAHIQTGGSLCCS